MSASVLEPFTTVSPDDVLVDHSAVETPVLRSGDEVKLVAFFYGDKLYGIPADEVAEVTPPLPVSLLPNGPAALSGIAPLRGEIVAVIDLRTLLREPASSQFKKSKFVILRSSANDTPLSFEVDRMHELVVAPDPGGGAVIDSTAIVMGTTEVEGQVISVVNGQALRAAIGK